MNSGPRSKPNSIALRLAVLYSLLSVALIIIFGSVTYSVLVSRLQFEDDQVLAGRIAELAAVAAEHPQDYSRVREEVERETVTFPGMFLRVLSQDGSVIAERSGPRGETLLELRPSSDTRAGGYDQIGKDGHAYRVMTRMIDAREPLIVQAALDLENDQRFLAAYWTGISIASVAALAVAIALGYVIARRGMRPISSLAGIMEGLNVKDLHTRVSDYRWPQELQPLASTFDGLLSRLEFSFARLSQFSADIAHELRTPLHILKGEVELALTHARTAEEYRRCLESASEEYERLSRLVEALLFLARSEQPDVDLVKRNLDVTQELNAVRDYYQAMADEREVVLDVGGDSQINADSDLLRRAVGNLVANALFHTPPGGHIRLESKAGDDGQVEVTVRDTGCGIASRDLPRVFDRFYRADAARQRQEQRVGLGLAIVQSIMQLHHGRVSLHSEEGKGTVVTLTFC